MKRLLIASVLAATTVFGLQAASAGNFTAGPLVQVSGVSPFLGCTADNVAGQSGTLFPNSEVEPWIDVNPTDQDGDSIVGDNIVGIWQQDRWSNGGARSLVAGVSFDGGSSWTAPVIIPGIAKCVGGIYDRSTDPWVSFSPNGVVHQLALSFNDIAPPFVEGEGGDFDHALLASKSTDGGLTWSQPVEVIRDLDANVFNDKQTITADPTDSNFVYAVWDRLIFPPSERASVISGFVTAAFRGPIWFARSTDGGNTWEPARQIFDPGQNDQTIGNQIVVQPNGTLVNIFDEIQNESRKGLRGLNVAIIRSTDKGVTWSQRIIVDKLGTIEIRDPETGDPVRTGDIIPDIAVNRANGRLYAVWQDARFNANQADAIAFSQSLDGGRTWSPTIKVNKTPTNIPIGNQQAFTPSVHVAADGTIGVTYYDFRKNTSATPLLTDYFVVHCHPSNGSCTSSANWGAEKRLTNVSFDMRKAPFARGFFTGDYEGLASDGNDFTPFFSQPHNSDPSSTFFRRVGP
jgi:BNR repeat-like domain